ncbi:hypothetical protein TSUD_386110 [Trifolium subterraneum]|uniref:Uncharacterized protein n=1 Tax=Trifolium subterraneum TaxID=3900 RepID=A0A2Z6MDZ0_TRISU|nr:hypothetical protein TSUD_386110 [Trifolium subterraneum]
MKCFQPPLQMDSSWVLDASMESDATEVWHCQPLRFFFGSSPFYMNCKRIVSPSSSHYRFDFANARTKYSKTWHWFN